MFFNNVFFYAAKQFRLLRIDGNRIGVFRDIICLHNHHSQEAGENHRGKRVLEIIKQYNSSVDIRYSFYLKPRCQGFFRSPLPTGS